ncbi:MAG: hypothetical protein M1816_003221 [Peltula sp. TS41687]|nr:MAG: hypothetical protein M1816_003221 [Peltula sp. TS41687]
MSEAPSPNSTLNPNPPTTTTTTPPSFTGSCYCQSTRYLSTSAPSSLTHCHCGACRKFHGAAFATFADMPASSLVWVAKEQLQVLQTSRWATRGFCRACGSMIFMRYDWEADRVGVAAGTIDDASYDPESFPKPSAHIFWRDRARWWDVADADADGHGDGHDGLQRFEEFSPGAKGVMERWERDHADADAAS